MSSHHNKPFFIHHPAFEDVNKQLNRRDFLFKSAVGLGALATGSLLSGCHSNNNKTDLEVADFQQKLLNTLPHFIPKAKRVVYLCMSGGPSQFETFDYKPELARYFGQNLPESVRNGQRLTGMSANQSELPVAPSSFKFNRHGKSSLIHAPDLPCLLNLKEEGATGNSL